jgi:hypothetical protein
VRALYDGRDMKKLTSGATFFGKRVFPVIFGCAAGSMALLISSQAIAISVFWAIPIGLIVGLLAAMFVARMHSEYMDEVLDDGDRLVIRNRGVEESIDLRDIREVDSTIMRPAGVRLHLRRDSAFGRSIKFLPGSSLLGFSKLAKSMNIRIKQAQPQR